MKDFLDLKNCGKAMFADTPTTGKENVRKFSNLSYHLGAAFERKSSVS